VRFQVLDILPYIPNPVTGRLPSPSERLAQSVQMAAHAERLGFDAYAYGERHAGHVLSPSSGVMLGAVAATTSRIRLQTGVCVLPILDPVRVAEDFATIDQLSRGRFELVIGKGNEARQFPLFGLDKADQDDLLVGKYELLRRLWRERDVSWSGPFRTPLEDATTLPRPYAGAPRVWHGSASTLSSVELAARWGDPLFSANAIQPRENYERLIDHYRERYAEHGHDSRNAYVGAGSGFLFISDTYEQAVREFGPIYEEIVRVFASRPGNATPYRDIEHAIRRGPVLVGTAEQVIDKIMYFHEAFNHDLQSFSLPTMLPIERQMEMLERLSAEVIPEIRRAAPTTLWSDADPYGGRPAFAGRTSEDAAAVIDRGGVSAWT
jgi:alkanesulfonate monooxygenase SsuD/methylene tetrahydromethanopterin reductase-like flavin-dependent oxidoreductase (luciferase family)